jgi:hypothetical protein
MPDFCRAPWSTWWRLPRARADKKRTPAYSLFDQLQTLAGQLDR